MKKESDPQPKIVEIRTIFGVLSAEISISFSKRQGQVLGSHAENYVPIKILSHMSNIVFSPQLAKAFY